MIKLSYKLLIVWLFDCLTGFAQGKGGRHEYVYSIDKRYRLLFDTHIVDNQDFIITFNRIERKKYRKRSDNYNNLLQDIWVGDMGMTMKPSLRVLQREIVNDNDSVCRVAIDSVVQNEEMAIYTWRYHHNIFTLFHMRKNKKDSLFSDLKYGVLYNFVFSLKKVDDIGIDWNQPYRVYLYEVRKKEINDLFVKNKEPYLIIGFCPQFGIFSYDYLKLGIKITLESIDGKPLEYYMQQNMCLTPFCEIK